MLTFAANIRSADSKLHEINSLFMFLKTIQVCHDAIFLPITGEPWHDDFWSDTYRLLISCSYLLFQRRIREENYMPIQILLSCRIFNWPNIKTRVVHHLTTNVPKIQQSKTFSCYDYVSYGIFQGFVFSSCVFVYHYFSSALLPVSFWRSGVIFLFYFTSLLPSLQNVSTCISSASWVPVPASSDPVPVLASVTCLLGYPGFSWRSKVLTWTVSAASLAPRQSACFLTGVPWIL